MQTGTKLVVTRDDDSFKVTVAGTSNAGFLDAAIAYNSLKDLGHNAQLTLEFKASMSTSKVEADAVVFPVVRYTIINLPALNDFTDFVNYNWNG